MTDQKNGQEYLSFVLEKLQARLAEISQSLLDGQKEIENMHDYYWQNYTEMDQYGYEDYDNQQALLHQVNANQEQLLLRSRFRKMLDSPFFGRVDFRYDGDDEPEIFYIGIGNFAERPGELPLIYDWRSPVSGLFYDFDRGPASYLAPGGEMTGEICSKWQYKIRDGKMIYGFESDVKIDDDILKAELGSNGEVQLKNIIRTIQKEQNAIIRNTKDRILVIQGAAGSGKTSVALHRIAYLLYHDRQNLKSSNILILSPNGVFSDYISHILPELGEENIQEMSFDLFAYRKLQDTAADCEDRCDQIEREMRDPKAAERFALKQSQAFVDQMEGFALELEDELMNFSDVSYKSFVKSESEIITLFYDKFADIPLLSRAFTAPSGSLSIPIGLPLPSPLMKPSSRAYASASARILRTYASMYIAPRSSISFGTGIKALTFDVEKSFSWIVPASSCVIFELKAPQAASCFVSVAKIALTEPYVFSMPIASSSG